MKPANISRADKPSTEAINIASELARKHPSRHLPTHREAVRHLLERHWPYRDQGDWTPGFRKVLDREAAAIERYRERRRKWDRKHPRRDTKEQIWAEDRERAESRRRREAIFLRIKERRQQRGQ